MGRRWEEVDRGVGGRRSENSESKKVEGERDNNVSRTGARKGSDGAGQWINESMDRSIDRLMDQWINGSMDRWINRSIEQSIDRSIDGSMDQWINGAGQWMNIGHARLVSSRRTRPSRRTSSSRPGSGGARRRNSSGQTWTPDSSWRAGASTLVREHLRQSGRSPSKSVGQQVCCGHHAASRHAHGMCACRSQPAEPAELSQAAAERSEPSEPSEPAESDCSGVRLQSAAS